MIGPRFEEEAVNNSSVSVTGACVSGAGVMSLALGGADIEWPWAVEETASELESRETEELLVVVLVSEEVVVGETPMVVMANGVPIHRQASGLTTQ